MTVTTDKTFEEITADTDRMLREMEETEASWAESPAAPSPAIPWAWLLAGTGVGAAVVVITTAAFN